MPPQPTSNFTNRVTSLQTEGAYAVLARAQALEAHLPQEFVTNREATSETIEEGLEKIRHWFISLRG